MSKTTKIVLVVIVVIAILCGLIKWVILPLIIHQQTQDTIENSLEGLEDNIEMTTFNARFLPFEGILKGDAIKSLIQTVANNNAGNDNKVSIDFSGTMYSNSNVSSISNLISSSDTYNVEIKYATNGYIETILID